MPAAACGVPLDVAPSRPIWPHMFEQHLPQHATRLVYPVLAMVLLTFVVLATLGLLRVGAVARRLYPNGYFKLMRAPEGTELPRVPEAVARNLINLLEVPVLFYAFVPLALQFGVTDAYTVSCLWAFVGFRYLHTAIHVSVNKIPLRFCAYLAAAIALGLAWVHLAFELL